MLNQNFFYSALLTISCGLFFFNNSHADKLKVGIIDFPPFYVIHDDASTSGLYLNILRKTLQHAKLEYSLDVYPPKRLYRNLSNGKAGVVLGIKGAPEYDKQVLYSTTKISQIQMRVYATGDTPLPASKAEINGSRISTIRGYSYGGLVSYFSDPKNSINVFTTAQHLASFQMLKNKRVDYVVNYKHPSETVLENLSIPNVKYTNFYSVDVFFIVSKATPNAIEVLQKLEKSYLELIKLEELEYIPNDD